MKKNIKRLSALLLTLCMLASLMVPVAFAVDVEPETPVAEKAETYPIRLKNMNHTDPTTAEGLDALLVKTGSSTGTNYIDLPLSDSKLEAAYADGTLNWKFVATSGKLDYRAEQMYQARLSYKSWGALQIRVTDTGVFALNLTSDKTVDDETAVTPWTNNGAAWAGNITAYIIPVAVVNDAVAKAVIPEVAEDETAPTAEVVGIESLMIDDYCVGIVAMAADQTDISFNKIRMEAGEYVVVYTAGYGSNFSICEMSLLETAADAEKYEKIETESYALRPYNMNNVDPATYAGTYNADLVTVNETEGADPTYTFKESFAVKTLFDDNSRYAALGWKYFAHDASDKNAFEFRQYGSYQPRIKLAEKWAAIQINVEDSGYMYLSMITDKSTPVEGASWTNNNTSWAGNVTAYLIPRDKVADADAIPQLIANSTYCVGTKTMRANETTVTFDRKYMEAGEYVLVYTATANNFYVCEMKLHILAREVMPELSDDTITGTVATYNFELYNTERYAPIFNNNGTTSQRGPSNSAYSGYDGAYEAGEGVGDILDREYANGYLNWNILNNNNTKLVFYANGTKGLRIQKDNSDTAASGWAAFRLNVPQTALYTVELGNSNNTAQLDVYIYDADAQGDVAANMTEANLAASFAAAAKETSFASVLTAGENIIVLKFRETTTKDTFNLTEIVLNVNDDPITYNFGLKNNENFVTAMREAVGDNSAEVPTNYLNSWSFTVDGATKKFAPYTTMATLFANGKMNWALDASSGTNADVVTEESSKPSDSDMKNFRANGDTLRLYFGGAESVSYAGLRIYVPYAGTYKVTTTVNDSLNLYLFKAPNTYDAYDDRLHINSEYGKLAEMIDAAEPFAVADGTNPAVGTYTFDQPGEYIFAVEQTAAKNTTTVYLSSMIMEPIAYTAIADGVAYTTFEEAVEKAADTVVMLKSHEVSHLVVPAGVTLDLNGFDLNAVSVDVASAANIIDSTDGNSAIRVAKDITFDKNNAQLPLYDDYNNAYYLYNVDVESVAVTGGAKYWFRVNFSNKAACDLIDANTELRIQAQMTGDGIEKTTASAKTAFSAAWADKYVANNNIYITVSAVNADGVENFTLTPGVSANGVVISGDAMA